MLSLIHSLPGFKLHLITSSYSPITTKNHLTALTIFAKSLNNPPVDQITQTDIINFFEQLRQNHRSKTTAPNPPSKPTGKSSVPISTGPHKNFTYNVPTTSPCPSQHHRPSTPLPFQKFTNSSKPVKPLVTKQSSFYFLTPASAFQKSHALPSKTLTLKPAQFKYTPGAPAKNHAHALSNWATTPGEAYGPI